MRNGILIAALLALASAADAAPNQFVTLSDGVEIALNVRMPDGYVPGRRYPTIFEMSGYDGGSRRAARSPRTSASTGSPWSRPRTAAS